jgi:phosphohistidine phosphatase
LQFVIFTSELRAEKSSLSALICVHLRIIPLPWPTSRPWREKFEVLNALIDGVPICLSQLPLESESVWVAMRLYLLRHGQADWPEWTGADDERPLTEEGIEEMRGVAAVLKRMKVIPDVILSSPLPRALKTAEIAGKGFGVKVRECEELRPGFERRRCDKLLATVPGDDVMLVGHEPDFSNVIRLLTGATVKMPKAGVACIEMGEELPVARLLFLFPAKMLARLTQ